jgi:hypothetical protein
MMNIHIVPGAMDDPGLFDSGNGFRGVPEICLLAVSYLNKHQAVAILHDQVDFAPPAAKVPA